MEYKLELRVRALMRITEGGWRHPGDPDAKFPSPNYIHAEKDEEGRVEHVNDDGMATVRFDRTGTSTIVGDVEIEVLAE